MNIYYGIYIALIFWAILSPAESLAALLFVGLKLRLVFTNLFLLLLAFAYYLRLSWDMARLGLPVPPFKFIPIEERHNG